MDTELPSPPSDSNCSTSSSMNTKSFTDKDNSHMLLASTSPKKRAGRKIFKETRHPVYRGVRLRNSGKLLKWVCEVREPTNQKRIWFGTHPTVEMAARAHDVAAIAFRGKLACLNFTDSAWLLPVPASSDIKDIQKAAAEAAQIFKPGKVEPLPLLQTKLHDQTICNNNTDDHPVVVVVMKEEDQQDSSSSQLYYMEDEDEEDVFRMPALLSDMFSGMMLPLPIYSDSLVEVDDSQFNFDFPLWT